MNGGAGVVWKPQRFEQFSKEGYQGNVTVFACINEISTAVSGIPWDLFRKAKGKKGRREKIEDHRLIDLLNRPNPLQGRGSFFESITAYLLISGNSYIEKVGPNRGLPTELWPIRPDRMTVIKDSVNRIRGHKFKLGSVEKDFVEGEILHRKTFSPINSFYGLSPIQVAAQDIDGDGESKRWNNALLKNDMKPPGILIAKGNLGELQYDRLKQQFSENYGGAKNAGKPLIGEMGLDWKQFGISQKDADWINGRKMSKREIMQVYQVPPEILGDGENKTYSNYKEARRAFYMETVLPHMDRLRDDLNNWITPIFGTGLHLDYDRDDIEALSQDRDNLYGRIAKAQWLTVNEKRLQTGFDEVVGGDVILVPMGLIPLGVDRGADGEKAFNWEGFEDDAVTTSTG